MGSVVWAQVYESYTRLQDAGEVPRIHAWVKPDPEGGWTVYVGQHYNPQSNLRKRFRRDQWPKAVRWAQLKVLKRMERGYHLHEQIRRKPRG